MRIRRCRAGPHGGMRSPMESPENEDASSDHRGRQLSAAGLADRPRQADTSAAGAGARARSCGGCRSRGSNRRRTMRPCSRSATWSAPASTSSPMARSAARAIRTALRRRSPGSISTTPRRCRGVPSGTVTVPRIVGPIRRLRPVEVRDVEFLRRNTDRTIKITLPGPFTMSRQAKNEYYKDEEELVMDYAAAVNAEIRDLKAAGRRCDPARRALGAGAPRRGAPPGLAGDRPGARRHSRADRAAPLLRLRLCRPRQAERLFVPARTDRHGRRADLDRGGAAQSRSRHPRRPRRQDRHLRRHQHGRPAAGNAGNRRRPHPPRRSSTSRPSG